MNLSAKQMLDLPPVWLFGFAVAVWGLGQIVPLHTGLGWLRGAGTGLVIAGVALILLAALQFRKHRTTIVPHQNASHLLTSGVYGWSRNPIYLGDVFVLAGLALRWDIPHGLVLVPIFVWVVQRRFILPEERRLKAAFGDTFIEYVRKVRRWA